MMKIEDMEIGTSFTRRPIEKEKTDMEKTTLDEILAFCQEKTESVKEFNRKLWEVINDTVRIIEEEGIDNYNKKLEKATEDYNRCYSQLLGMLELAQAIYDPENKEGYFTVTNTDAREVDKVVFKRFEE